MRTGIIGCGGIATAHINGWLHNKATITAVTDVNPQAAQAAAEAAGGATVFADYTALLDSGTVDAVSICTPPTTHEAIALYAIKKGVHVLCEKPLADTPVAAQRIAAAAAQSSVRFMVAFRHRYLPAIVKLRELIQSGTIGIPVAMQNTFWGPAFQMKDRWFSKKELAGGGTLMDTSVHSVDIFRFLFGEIVEQHAVINKSMSGINVEDSSILTVKSACGVLGTLSAAWVSGCPMAVIDIFGQKGRLTYDYTVGNAITLRIGLEPEAQIIPVEKSSGFAEEIAHFIDAIKTGSAISSGAEDGLRALQIIYDSVNGYDKPLA